MSEELLGKYTVVGRLGIGGMAEVYLCRLVGIGGFDKQLVIKRIRADVANNYEFVEMFLDEARVAANLAHPNIVQIFEIDMLEGLPYISMEYVEGQTLAAMIHMIRTRDRQDFGNIAHILADVCAGLHHAHNARDASGKVLEIVHRDISPQNIIVSNDGIAKVFDFGVAKAKGQLGITDAGTVKGKIGYMAPEQLRARPVDGKADVYAVGVCLYETTVGKRPFVGFTEGEVFAARAEGLFAIPTEAVPGYPEELERIVLRAMAPEPEGRPSAADLEDELRAFATSQNRDAHTVSAWLYELFPERTHEPPIRRSSRLDAVTASNRTSVTIATGSKQSRPSGMMQEAAKPRSNRGLWIIIAALLAIITCAVVYLALRTTDDKRIEASAVSQDDAAVAAKPAVDAGVVAKVEQAVDAAIATVATNDKPPVAPPEPAVVAVKPPPDKRPPADKPAKPARPVRIEPVAPPPVAGSASVVPPPTVEPPPVKALPPIPPTQPPVAPPTVPPVAARPAEIPTPRLPATYSVRTIKELGKVLAVIEQEAIDRGGAPASIHGVSNAMAEQAFAGFVPGDLIELHPRDLYFTIVRGSRAGKPNGTIAAELKGKL